MSERPRPRCQARENHCRSQGVYRCTVSWALSRSGLYFHAIDSGDARSPEHVIRYLDFESGQIRDLHRKEGRFFRMGLAVSHDEEWILYSEMPPRTSELMLIENFR